MQINYITHTDTYKHNQDKNTFHYLRGDHGHQVISNVKSKQGSFQMSRTWNMVSYSGEFQ
jgi:hypothetical protein